MKVLMDVPGEITFEDIPDDLMAIIEQRAVSRGWSPEEELRDIILDGFGSEASATLERIKDDMCDETRA